MPASARTRNAPICPYQGNFVRLSSILLSSRIGVWPARLYFLPAGGAPRPAAAPRPAGAGSGGASPGPVNFAFNRNLTTSGELLVACASVWVLTISIDFLK